MAGPTWYIYIHPLFSKLRGHFQRRGGKLQKSEVVDDHNKKVFCTYQGSGTHELGVVVIALKAQSRQDFIVE